MSRRTHLRFNGLGAGTYKVTLDEQRLPDCGAAALAAGFKIDVPANTTRMVRVHRIAEIAAAPPHKPLAYDQSVTYLSDLTEVASQRGVGLPKPTFRKDRSFRDNSIAIRGQVHNKGLGLAANTVLVYQLDGRYRALEGLVGITDEAAAAGPPPALRLTMFADGHCAFDSGPLHASTAARPVKIDLRGVEMLVIRVSGNWEHNGDLTNAMGALADARLVGSVRSS